MVETADNIIQTLINKKPHQQSILLELKHRIPSEHVEELINYLTQEDGASKYCDLLPKYFSPESIMKPAIIGELEPSSQRAWELIGWFYQLEGRYNDALSIYTTLYNYMLTAQETLSKRMHKGMPLVYIADLYGKLGCIAHAKRYLMLTLCEDAILHCGIIPTNQTGIYFRLVWGGGLTDTELKRYAAKIYELNKEFEEGSKFPEFVLQKLDQSWMTEIPTSREASMYVTNSKYIRFMINRLGDGTGKMLEDLAEYILLCMPGCRTKKRLSSLSSEYDIICSIDGVELDFRSEMGRYFVCECKDRSDPANVTDMAKFCRILDSTKSRFGILFSKSGVTGAGKNKDAEHEQFKLFFDRGIIIVVINYEDLNVIEKGSNFINILRDKYEQIRLDLSSPK